MASWWTVLTELGLTAWTMIMVIAVTALCGIVAITKMLIKHRERMAMIEKGMDPGPAAKAYQKDGDA